MRGILVWLCLCISPMLLATEMSDFTQQMQHHQGYFDFYYHSEEDKVFLVVDKFETPFIFQSSLPRGIGSNDIGLDRGQQGDTRLVQFEQYGNKVLLKQLNTYYRADSDNSAEQQSVDEAFASSVIAGLPVVASTEDKVLVDYTEFLLSDIHNVSERLEATEQGSFKADAKRSGVHLARSKGFPRNTELESLVTFAGSKAGDYVKQVTPEPAAVSVHLHHSLIALPEEGYQSRPFHPYSGYWKVEFMDYAAAIDEPMVKRLLPRHRLVKKDPAADVSEAVEPIVFYLDPGVPEPVRTALYEGAMWWDTGFERIGYKNAFQVRPLPEDADPMDVRYNVIQWVHRATRGWSYGRSITDPRTGEIIKGHVTLGSLRVRQDFLIANGLTSPFDENADTSEQQAMALARIRQLSAHEVGHTLGIIHNFAASANGRASVMDYPHPLAEIKNGKVVLNNAYREGLGEWDLYAIEMGYANFADDHKAMAELAAKAKAQGLEYMADRDARPAGGASTIGHLWDNGQDPVAELKRLSEVRRLALQNFGLDSIADKQALSSLHEALVPIYLLHRYQVEAVAKQIGGVHYEYELKGEHSQPKGVRPVSADKQQAALSALLETISAEYLALPVSLLELITPKIYGDQEGRESFKARTGLTFDPISAAEAAANNTLNLLLHPQRLNRVAQQQSLGGIHGLYSRLLESTFKATPQHGYQRQVHNRVLHVMLYRWVDALSQTELAPEVRADMYAALSDLEDWLDDNDDSNQHKYLQKQIENYLDKGEWAPLFKPLPLPPGSPI
ncbi:zinc-dependent metalloprotease [Lacimicrobium alkaliphilum]|uniref:Periplasmic metalloprotease n=1 Tax=Lacimicrobium alkaliphilum TaxID=1526571 RepID=A0ABQ1RN63_9ALTE|nr:zinc-dependent metalloprotease [Lacimicrobium alkaliphilum]GGD73179.1 periplasmic metalloprotease [Lacimicrobium alkaliphilum]